jgi:hypothetical protein
MSNESDARLLKTVNSSGFPLQIAISDAIKKADMDQKWGVLAEEHPWSNQISGQNGFIDLILDYDPATQILVVECKRVRDSEWVFLVPSDKNGKNCRRAKAWTSYPSKCFFGWLDRDVKPGSPESNYCVVAGQDAKSKPMLERVASEVVEATEALAREERSLGVPRSGEIRTYFSAIVTTADLKICLFDKSEIDIASGEIPQCDFEDVQWIRFRKSLTARNEDSREDSTGKEINKIFQEKERTVFVVNSVFFLDFLKAWEIGNLPSTLR